MRILLLLVSIISFSCNKIVEKVAEDVITSLIIDYDWYVHSFEINGKDSTHLFDTFTFDFQNNDQVIAQNSVDLYYGSWVANTSTLTIESNFQSDLKPLQLLSTTWTILGTTNTTVRATTIKEGKTYHMKLYRVEN